MATDFAQAMREKARELTIRGTITFASGVQIALTGEEIMRYALREGVSDGVLPGAVLSASHTLELANAQGEWLPGGAKLGGQVLSGATVQLELGVKLEGGWAYSPLGLFVVSEASGEEGGVLARRIVETAVLRETSADDKTAVVLRVTAAKEN